MDHNSKLLTISIAAYNVESSLGRTLASLEIQEELFDRLDIIIVDDGSSDGTAVIADGFAQRHPGSVRVIHKQNGGYGSTVNTSIQESKGLYFKLLDGDDTFDRAGLEGLLRYLDFVTGHTEDADIPDLVISPFVYDRCGNSMAGEAGERGVNLKVTSSELCDRHMHLQTETISLEDADLDDGLMMFEICVRTDILRASGVALTEDCFYTDNEYVMTAELYSSDAVRYPFPVYRYSVGVEGQSMSVESRRARYDEKIRAARGVFDIYDRYTDMPSHNAAGAKKLITDRLLSTMIREVYVSLMIQDRPEEYRKVLSGFDKEISGTWPYIYDVSKSSRLVSAARKAGALSYPALCRHVLQSEMRRMGEDNRGAADLGAGMPDGRAGRFMCAAEYIVAACMIIQCRTVYMHLKDYGMIVNRSVWAVMMAALAVCIFLNVRQQDNRINADILPEGTTAKAGIDRKLLLLSSGIAAYATVFILVNPVNYLRVIRCAAAVIMITVLIGSRGGKACSRRIMSCYSDIMVVIAVVSLLCWIGGSVIKFLPCTGYFWMDWSATGEYVRIPTFLGIYFETQWTGWEIVQARNSGMFVEAPMAGCAYSIALLFEYMLSGPLSKSPAVKLAENRKVRQMILTAAVLSTLSLISYGFLILLLLAGLLTGERIVERRGRGKAATVSIIIAGSAILAVFVFNKLQVPSGNVRLSDFEVGFHAWLAHPFFGGGFESLEYLQQFMPEWRSFDVGFSNSPMEILGQGGIYLAAPYVYAFASSALAGIRKGDRRMLMAVLLFAYIFTFTVIPYQYITFFILIVLSAKCGCIAADDSEGR